MELMCSLIAMKLIGELHGECNVNVQWNREIGGEDKERVKRG